ncbi:hypothetical protein T484DRAFT_1750695 [Baffinella frigidus]|nr:hypothetical protein T484DRAFT_1750695 [Cryptophyta sp. CCMP2293]
MPPLNTGPIADALVREFLTRHGLTSTLAAFDQVAIEFPAASWSSMRCNQIVHRDPDVLILIGGAGASARHGRHLVAYGAWQAAGARTRSSQEQRAWRCGAENLPRGRCRLPQPEGRRRPCRQARRSSADALLPGTGAGGGCSTGRCSRERNSGDRSFACSALTHTGEEHRPGRALRHEKQHRAPTLSVSE